MTRIEAASLSPSLTPSRSGLATLLETTKPGISRLVTLTALVGFVLAIAQLDSWSLAGVLPAALGCALGTYLSAGGANALNMWLEGARDANMDRTKRRPIPSGRVSPRRVAIGGTVLALLGILILALFCGVPAAMVSLACVVSYVLIYTPLKTKTVLNTLVGTIPGALPALIGTAAGAESRELSVLLDPFGMALVALMVIWQLPHFMAIAWMYRDDYRQGGYRMLPGLDVSGRMTGWVMVLTAALMIPAIVALPLTAPTILGWVFVGAASLLTLGFVAVSVIFLRSPSRQTAKRVFLVSVLLLPALFLLMTGEAAIRLML